MFRTLYKKVYNHQHLISEVGQVGREDLEETSSLILGKDLLVFMF